MSAKRGAATAASAISRIGGALRPEYWTSSTQTSICGVFEARSPFGFCDTGNLSHDIMLTGMYEAMTFRVSSAQSMTDLLVLPAVDYFVSKSGFLHSHVWSRDVV